MAHDPFQSTLLNHNSPNQIVLGRYLTSFRSHEPRNFLTIKSTKRQPHFICTRFCFYCCDIWLGKVYISDGFNDIFVHTSI